MKNVTNNTVEILQELHTFYNSFIQTFMQINLWIILILILKNRFNNYYGILNILPEGIKPDFYEILFYVQLVYRHLLY